MISFQQQILSAALDCIRLGWKVLPVYLAPDGRCRCGRPECHSPGFHIMSPGGFNDASKDPATIRRWFNNGIDFNLGIVLGPVSNLVVVEIDPSQNGDTSFGQTNAPKTLEAVSPAGKRQCYYHLPSGFPAVPETDDIAPGLRILCEDSFVLAPPSIDSKGRQYQWNTDPLSNRPTLWPGSLKRQACFVPPAPGASAEETGDILPDRQTTVLFEMGRTMFQQGYRREQIYAAIIQTNMRRCKPPMDYFQLQKIAERIVDLETASPGDILIEDDRPDTLAAMFEASSPRKYRHQAGTWYCFEGGRYTLYDPQELCKDIRTAVKDLKTRTLVRSACGWAWQNKKIPLTPQKLSGIMDAFAALDTVRLSPQWIAPCWLPAKADSPQSPRPDPDCVLPLQNALLDISGDAPVPMKPAADFFTREVLPVVFDPQADCPAWKAFLNQTFRTQDHTDSMENLNSIPQDDVPDEQSVGILQEWMGLLLDPAPRIRTLLALVGPGDGSGEIICRVMEALAGPDLAAAIALDDLCRDYYLPTLLRKSLVFISDADLSDESAAARKNRRRLKSLVTHPHQQIQTADTDRPQTGRPHPRFIVTADFLHRMIDSEGILADCMTVLQAASAAQVACEPVSEARILAELPGVFNWALQGLFRLRRHGCFTRTPARQEVRDLMRRSANPIAAFVHQACRVEAGIQIRGPELYQAYLRWANDNDQPSAGRNRFYELFQQAFPNCRRVRTRMETDTNPVCTFLGVCLQENSGNP